VAAVQKHSTLIFNMSTQCHQL